MKVPAWAGRAVSSRVSSHINTYVYTQLSRVRRRHTRTGACIRNRNAATEAARTAVLAPLCRTLTVSGARINPGTWTGPTEPYVPSHPAYGSRLCDSFSTAEHHFPSRNKSGIYAFFWMGLHEVVLGVLDFFFYGFLIVSWSPGVFCGGKGFDDFCLCSMVMLHAMRFPLLPRPAPGTCL